MVMIHTGIDILDLSLRINWLSRRHPQTQTNSLYNQTWASDGFDPFDDLISIDSDDPSTFECFGFSVSFSDVAMWQVGLPLHLAISAAGRDLRRGSGTWKLNPCRLELSVYDFRDASFDSFCSWII